jgi:hypothetical protein
MLSTDVIRLVGKEKGRNTGDARPPSCVGLKLGLFFLVIWQWRQRQNEPHFYIGPEDTFGDGISGPKRMKKHNRLPCVQQALATTALPSALRVPVWSGGLCFMGGDTEYNNEYQENQSRGHSQP